jgi:hypothetical protein
MFKKIILVLALFTISSCSVGTPKLESPVIYFSNASVRPIKNIRVQWVNNTALSLQALNPGDSRSQSFYMHNNSQFFGLVKVTWTNDVGDNILREFYFRENHMPSINDRSTYNYAQIYFDQNDLEIVGSDAPDLPGKTVRMDRLLANYKNQFVISGQSPHSIGASSLIAVDTAPVKDRSTPGWLQNSF